MRRLALFLTTASLLATSASAQISVLSNPPGGGASGPVTLTGNVTGTGTGTVATTIANNAVTYGKLQSETANTVLGNPTGAGAVPSEITLAGGLAFSGTTLTAASKANLTGGNTWTGAQSLSGGTYTFDVGGGFLLSSGDATAGFVNTTTANSFPEINIRPTSGVSGVISWTHAGVADRWSNGVKTADGNLYWSAGDRILGTIKMTLSSVGLLNAIGGYTVGANNVINSSGVLQAVAMPALTGDVTSAGGSLTTALSSATVVSKVSAQALAPASVAATGLISSSGATSGIGYATGAGGTITQITSRVTGVTLNKACGAITLVSAAGSATWSSFTVTDSAVAATDVIIANQKSGTDIYILSIHAIAAGSFVLSSATTGGTTTETPVIQYCVVKGVNA